MKSLLAFIRLTRPTFLAGGFVGGALGTTTAALERGTWDPRAYVLAQATITAVHLMTQYANEYFDRHGDRVGDVAGGDPARTEYSGGSGVLGEGVFAPAVALRAALLCALAGTAGTIALGFAGAGLAAVLAVAMALGAWTYSAPPFRLCARGLGELDTAIVVATLVPLVAFAAQAGAVDARAVAVTLPGFLAMLAMMIAVEVPDRAADVASAKRNLVVRLGRARATRLGACAVAAAIAAVPLAVTFGASAAAVPLVIVALPVGAGLARAFVRPGGASFSLDESIAARGVAFFFLVSFGMTLGEAALLGRAP